MEYAYAALLVTESGEELNEQNLTAVLDAANCASEESRTKALVAALEDVDVGGIGPSDIVGIEDAADERDPDGDGHSRPSDDNTPR